MGVDRQGTASSKCPLDSDFVLRRARDHAIATASCKEGQCRIDVRARLGCDFISSIAACDVLLIGVSKIWRESLRNLQSKHSLGSKKNGMARAVPWSMHCYPQLMIIALLSKIHIDDSIPGALERNSSIFLLLSSITTWPVGFLWNW